MEPFGGEQELEVTEVDLAMMDSVTTAFDSCPILVSGLPSMVEDFKGIIKNSFQRDKFAPNLNDVSVRGALYTMPESLGTLLMSFLKMSKSNLGNKQPVFIEEVELMLEQEGKENMNSFLSCMKKN